MKAKPGFKQTDVGAIPVDWDVSTVGDEFEIKLGKMLDVEKNVGVPKPYLGNKGIQWNRIDLDELNTVPMTPYDIRQFRLRDGDLLVCEGGEVGRGAIWNSPIDECYYQKAIHRLRSRRKYDPRIMLAFLRFWSNNKLLSNYVTQTSIAHLTREKLLEIPLPRPSVQEQEAIAEALGNIDSLIDSVDRLIAKKRDLKKGAMHELLTGNRRLVTPKESGDRITAIGRIPMDWQVESYGDVFQTFSTATYSRNDLSKTGDVTYVHYGDIHTKLCNFLDPSKVDLPAVTFEMAKKYTYLKNGDVLMVDASEDYDGVCKSVEVENLGDIKAISGLHTFLLRDTEEVFADGFRGYLTSIPSVAFQCKKLATGMKVFGVSKTNLKQILIPVPPKNEQGAIAGVLTEMAREIEQLERECEKYKTIKQGMTHELLTGKTRLI